MRAEAYSIDHSLVGQTVKCIHALVMLTQASNRFGPFVPCAHTALTPVSATWLRSGAIRGRRDYKDRRGGRNGSTSQTQQVDGVYLHHPF